MRRDYGHLAPADWDTLRNTRNVGHMDSFDETSEAQSIEHDEDDEELEVTDIASDEQRDGDVDADGASAIRRRNE